MFIFFAVNLAVFESLTFPHRRSRMGNVAAMVDAIFKDNGGARIVGLRKWLAKQRSGHYGGLLFAPESIEAFHVEAAARGIDFPDVREMEIPIEQVVVAGK